MVLKHDLSSKDFFFFFFFFLGGEAMAIHAYSGGTLKGASKSWFHIYADYMTTHQHYKNHRVCT